MANLAVPILVALVAVVVIPMGLHSVPEGHVGVYWRGGALLSTVTQPGTREVASVWPIAAGGCGSVPCVPWLRGVSCSQPAST